MAATVARRMAFLLDIDGTLCHSDGIYFKVFQRLLAPHGYKVDDAFYAENVHGKVDADGEAYPRVMGAHKTKGGTH